MKSILSAIGAALRAAFALLGALISIPGRLVARTGRQCSGRKTPATYFVTYRREQPYDASERSVAAPVDEPAKPTAAAISRERASRRWPSSSSETASSPTDDAADNR